MDFQHKPIFLKETLDYLNPSSGMVIVDCTLGGGGHSKALLERILPTGKLIALDQDLDAINAAEKVLRPLGKENYMIFHSNFKDLEEVIKKTPFEKVDGIIYDLGVSSYQLDEPERGFSYRHDAMLDMRMDRDRKETAFDLVNKSSIEELTDIIRDYGEEKWAKRIAIFIENKRIEAPIKTTGELVNIIKKAIPAGARQEGGHPAKRTFQALRIAVNKELDVLAPALKQGIKVLKKGGKLAVITFHSLEDRITKQVYKEMAQGCTCPPDLPICVCNNKPKVKILTRKPVIPTENEKAENPRARSAKLRVVEKL
ncbi:MAG: 16S rRNA (cytosine(1402)-N(4))-methyltransferase RsmH [Clostridia bacterium]|nr:16S rRNA (cytosine(1402)-N(4))-methyltransferase RsmH [Clostridia bacterium]MDD4047260.1 16S rRNA (cytosine(1402)-N(4))-methyltransferase RsmH [Clostridia bacterium]